MRRAPALAVGDAFFAAEESLFRLLVPLPPGFSADEDAGEADAGTANRRRFRRQTDGDGEDTTGDDGTTVSTDLETTDGGEGDEAESDDGEGEEAAAADEQQGLTVDDRLREDPTVPFLFRSWTKHAKNGRFKSARWRRKR